MPAFIRWKKSGRADTDGLSVRRCHEKIVYLTVL
jgi:hypothetical protein